MWLVPHLVLSFVEVAWWPHLVIRSINLPLTEATNSLALASAEILAATAQQMRGRRSQVTSDRRDRDLSQGKQEMASQRPKAPS